MPNPRPIHLVEDSPKIDGSEALERVKSDPGLCHIPVMPASTRYAPRRNAFAIKPVEFTEFSNAVQSPGVFRAIRNEPPPRPGQP